MRQKVPRLEARITTASLMMELPAGVYTAIVGSKTNSGQAVAGADALR